MELILEKELEHQQKAVNALRTVFSGVNITKPILPYENPTLNIDDTILKSNIKSLQKNILFNRNGCRDEGEYLNLDIKMETGERVIIVIGCSFNYKIKGFRNFKQIYFVHCLE